jgi:hypothetical protein
VCSLFFAGEPLLLTDDWLERTINSTKKAISDEVLHTRCVANPLAALNSVQLIPDPDRGRTGNAESPSMSADPLEIWKMLPALRDLPVSMLQQLSRSEVFQLNAALVKESKNASKIQTNAKLLMNAQQLERNPERVEAGWDDRKKLLHRARFLGGASCTAQQLWLEAREVLGPNGITAIGNYDLDSLGCGGCVTPKGWALLHDPSSSDLKLKLFYLPNVGGSALSTKRLKLEENDSEVNIGENYKEIADMEGLKAALNTLREAMHCALPWNRSISAIVGFMTNTSFCSADLNNNQRRAAILAEFIDYTLSRNALNWENKQPFLSADDLSHTWASWKARRSLLFTAGGGSGGGSGKKQNAKARDDICRKYNSQAGCPNAATECRTFYGNKLRHVCNVMTGGGERCEKDHPKSEHK